jgi:hypothetical protein
MRSSTISSLFIYIVTQPYSNLKISGRTAKEPRESSSVVLLYLTRATFSFLLVNLRCCGTWLNYRPLTETLFPIIFQQKGEIKEDFNRFGAQLCQT